MSDIVKRLQEPAYWISSSNEGHEGESDVPREAADTITRLTSENEKLGRDYQSARDAHDKVLAENEKLRAVLDILQAAMTAKKPIPLAFKKAIIEARAALSGDKHE